MNFRLFWTAVMRFNKILVVLALGVLTCLPNKVHATLIEDPNPWSNVSSPSKSIINSTFGTFTLPNGKTWVTISPNTISVNDNTSYSYSNSATGVLSWDVSGYSSITLSFDYSRSGSSNQGSNSLEWGTYRAGLAKLDRCISGKIAL